jgi:MFS family permease
MPNPPDAEENRLAACFQNRNFRLLWTSQVFGQSAQIAIFFVLMVMMEELTQSSALVGLMVLVYNLPSILLSLPSGVIVDRFRKKHILLACNISRVFIVAGFIFFNRYGQGGGLLPGVYILTLVLSTVGQLSDPAESAMVPLLVPADQLLAANSVFHLLFNVAQVLGLLLLAPLSLKLGGVDGAFATISLTYLLTAGLIWPISAHEAEPERHPAGDALRRFWVELQEGWRFIISREPVLTAIAQHGLIQVVSMIIAVFAPGFFTRVLGMQPADAIYILFFAGLGMFLTTMWTGRLGHRFSRRTLAAAGLLIMGLGLLGLAYVAWRGEVYATSGTWPSQQTIMLVVSMALMLGVGGTLAVVAVQTTVQERTPRAIRGRVIAAEFLFANVVGLIPMLLVSGLADIIGIRTVLLGLSITVLVSAMISFRARRWPWMA